MDSDFAEVADDDEAAFLRAREPVIITFSLFERRGHSAVRLFSGRVEVNIWAFLLNDDSSRRDVSVNEALVFKLNGFFELYKVIWSLNIENITKQSDPEELFRCQG